jgi:hypothetical protein
MILSRQVAGVYCWISKASISNCKSNKCNDWIYDWIYGVILYFSFHPEQFCMFPLCICDTCFTKIQSKHSKLNTLCSSNGEYDTTICTILKYTITFAQGSLSVSITSQSDCNGNVTNMLW